MKVKKVNSKSIILHKNSQVKLKTSGISREIQFMTGNNTSCPIRNISKDKFLDMATGEVKDTEHNTN